MSAGLTAAADALVELRIARLPAIAWLLLAGLSLRVFIAYFALPMDWHRGDSGQFLDWAMVLVEHGPGGFYTNAQVPDYPPGYLYVLWALGWLSKSLMANLAMDPGAAIMMLVKASAITADLLTGLVLYRAVRGWADGRAALTAAALYLFIPVTWYDSALWGQVDSVGTLLLVISIIFLLKGWSEPAAVVGVLTVITKAQYAPLLGIIAVVLLRRHLVRRPAEPSPPPSGSTGTRLGCISSYFATEHGPIRIATSAAAGGLTGFLALAPFDIQRFAPADLAGVPVVGHFAGLLGMLGARAANFNFLTANAFNPWALVGDNPLSRALTGNFYWTYDSIHVIGIPALVIGLTLFSIVAVTAAIGLLWRTDRQMVLLAATVVSAASFVLLTRAHERWIFPVFATGALLAAGSVRFRWWYVALGFVNAANLHAIFTLPFVSNGPAAQGLPFGAALRQEWSVIVIAAAHALLFAWAFLQLMRSVRWRSAWADAARAASDAYQRLSSRIPSVARIRVQHVTRALVAGGFVALIGGTLAIQFYGLTDRPSGFYIDESSFSYNAWTIIQNGVDEHGRFWPIFFEAFGDWKTAPYIYLLSGAFSVAGPSILAARAVSALAGVVAVFLMASLAYRVTRHPLITLLTGAMILLLPWTFEPTKLAQEVALMPALLAAFLVMLHLRPPSRLSWVSVAGLAAILALVTYAYTLGRLLGPLLALGLIVYIGRRHWQGVIATWMAYGVLLLPLLLFEMENRGALAVRLAEGGYLGMPLHEFAATFVRQLIGNLDPVRLLFEGDPNHRHHAPGIMGSLLIGTAVLGMIGIVVAARRLRIDPWHRYLVFGLAASLVPASLTLHPFHAHRLIAVPIFLIAVSISAQEWLRSPGGWLASRRLVLAAIAALILFQGAYFQFRYDDSARGRGAWFDADYPRLLEMALATGADPVYLEDGIVPGYVHGYWYGAVWGVPADRFVHLPRDIRAPPGGLVLSSVVDCSPCEELASGGFFRVYRVLGP